MSKGDLHPALVGLEPRSLWERFDEIRQIPRASQNEEGVRAYLENLAAEHDWKCVRDGAGNVVIYVPGVGAGKRAPALAIQGHMDMVCVKRREVEHDFDADPIELKRAELELGGAERVDCLQACDTSLGSDNGVGIAAGLAIALDPDLEHPPLELIFTADEERGMTGAEGLDVELISARRMLNLDAEEHGSIYLSCAGGRDLVASWSIEREDIAADDLPVWVTISGLAGGHSGVEIHLGRQNAISLLVQALTDGAVELDGVRLGKLDGGAASNAIPRSAEALLWCARHRAEPLVDSLIAVVQLAMDKFLPEDRAGIHFEARIGEREEIEGLDPDTVGPLSAATTRMILKALATIPDGVIAMSEALEGLVETSSNLGVVKTGANELSAKALTRSSKVGGVVSVQDRIERRLEASGAFIEFENEWPGWEADLTNPLVNRSIAVFEDLFESQPAIKAIHGGLECGFFAQRIPGLAMISFGPEIRNAHTPDEAIVLDTVPPFFELVRALVKDLCRA
jgi:dipeptidase D